MSATEAIRAQDNPKVNGLRAATSVDWRRLFRYVQPYRARLALAIVCLFISSVLGLMVPLVAGLLVDALSGGTTAGRSTVFDALFNFYTDVLKRNPPQFRGGVLNWVALAMLGVFVVQSLFNFVQSYLIAYVGERVVADLRVQVFQHLQSLSLSYFSDRRVGEITSRVTSDVTVIQQTTTVNVAMLLQNTISFGGGLALMLFLSYKLTLLTMVVVPLMLVAAVLFGRRIRNISTEVQDRLANATAVLEETIAGVRVVQSFAREPYEIGRFRNAIEEAFRTSMRRTRLRSTFLPLVSFFGFSALVLVLWYGGRQVVSGQMSSGDLVSFLFYSGTIAAALGTFTGLYAQLQEALGATSRVFGILDTTPTIRDKPGAVPLPTINGLVEFQHVDFTYDEADPGDHDGIVLQDVCLSVQPGEIVAVVGPSGAGKTTLVNMIPRFYDPVRGRITIDGYDLRDVQLATLRAQIGIVPQETLLFSGTIKENLAYGRLDATDEEIVAAARAANADEFIRALPGGYNSIVGERGFKLSGGQRQRVAIARAILKNSRILILDEATSALDSESEGLVQEALERLMHGRTTFIIAHRLSTVKVAHRIVVLDRGRIVEQGTHEELMARGGLYFRLYSLQFSRDAAVVS
ncbi:MAG TPA: ABC transporter ATP-binding protein [Herpetosiphonaceae bacterium]|nr:ABC transporter ATP-binding protein [Herpetosiphonaceae bacterium]